MEKEEIEIKVFIHLFLLEKYLFIRTYFGKDEKMDHL